ncbi:MAG TPA: hypothetical protein VGK01_15145 [Candidatus Angelobacter sp.]|jgi:hypothetical protein
MNTNSIVDELTQQRDRISAAITALTVTNHTKQVVSSAAPQTGQDECCWERTHISGHESEMGES